MYWKKFVQSRWMEIVFLMLISGLVYLPRIGELTYFKDDWYYMYDGLVSGTDAFFEMFRYLRPIRGPLYALLFSLFGTKPLPYHILLYAIRVLGGLSALWLFRMLWPTRRHVSFFFALLYLLYPGFLWWVAGIEYQPMVLSATLQVLSIALTIKYIERTDSPQKWNWLFLSLLTGWAYLAFVEYAIGMEAFRWVAIFLMMKNRFPDSEARIVLRKALTYIIPTLIIPIAFLFWHQFIFENHRKAADIGFQVSQVFDSPIRTALWWGLRSFQSVINISVLAWGVPLSDIFFSGRLSGMISSLLITGVVISLVIFCDRLLSGEDLMEDATQGNWYMPAIFLGFLGVVISVSPIVIVNRYVEFQRFSHYALPGSLAGIVFVGGMVYALKPQAVRSFALAILIGISALTHTSNANAAVVEEETIRDFWWQVSWRAPQIVPDTTLVVRYPEINYGDGSDIVWGPANFIYYPERQNTFPLTVNLIGARMENVTIKQILTGSPLNQNVTQNEFDQVLIMSQPSHDACVHVIDARWAGLSMGDDAVVIASASRSRAEQQISLNGDHPDLPEYLFGQEPSHDWCYYYQKADLARQQGAWETIVELDRTIEKLGFHPNDQIELLPFVQAYAYLGDMKMVKQLSTRINTETYYKEQTCEILNSMGEKGYPLSPDMIVHINELFCGGN